MVRMWLACRRHRVDVLPDIPTLNEFVPGYEASAFWGIGAPKATPAEIVDKLNKEINAALADPKMKNAARRLWRHDAFWLTCPFWESIADDTEKVEEGDPRGQHQGGIGPHDVP